MLFICYYANVSARYYSKQKGAKILDNDTETPTVTEVDVLAQIAMKARALVDGMEIKLHDSSN